MRIPKTVRNTLLSLVILFILFLGAGVAYVVISDRQTQPLTTLQVPNKASDPSAIKPQQPAANAPESAAIEDLISPVKLGSNTSVTIKTLAGSKCTINVTYNNVPSKDSGLVPKTADDFGSLTWAWTVEPTAAVGTWPVKITCALGAKSAFVQGDLQVTK